MTSLQGRSDGGHCSSGLFSFVILLTFCVIIVIVVLFVCLSLCLVVFLVVELVFLFCVLFFYRYILLFMCLWFIVLWVLFSFIILLFFSIFIQHRLRIVVVFSIVNQFINVSIVFPFSLYFSSSLCSDSLFCLP